MRAGPPGTERGHDLRLRPTAQQEHQERIIVEALAEQIVHGGDVLAWIGPVGTRAARLHVLPFARKETAADRGEQVLDILGHLAAEQARRVPRLRCHRVDDALPVRIAEARETDRDAVRLRPTALHDGRDTGGGDVERYDLAGAGVRAAARQPTRVDQPLQRYHPATRPPRRTKRAATGVRLDAVRR